MNKKTNVIFWVGVKSTDPKMSEKHGGFKYLDISEKCWIKWCEKNDVIFCPYKLEDVNPDFNLEIDRVTWTRHFDVFRVLKKKKIKYKKIAIIDGSTLIHPNAPNFFDLVLDTGLTCFRSLENLRWLAEGVFGYKEFFDNFEFEIPKYFSCGFTIFGKNHRQFLTELYQFYRDHQHAILRLQNEKVKRGTDQIVYNYLAQIKGIKVNLDVLPKRFMITHLERFQWTSFNWQLAEHGLPHFIKHSWIWFYSGMANREIRYNMMRETWKILEKEYGV